MTHQTDKQLITQARAGDRLAAGQLLERHRRPVAALAHRALGNADDAHDVAQETLVYALQRLPELREPSKLSAWLRQLTLSHCADYRRRRATRRLGEPITLLNETAEEADYAERLAVRQSLNGLSDAHRTTLLLHYLGGWSLQEVAELLAIPVNTVRSRLLAAKRVLRSDLRPLFVQRKPMPTRLPSLTRSQTSLINEALPGARIVSVQTDPEPWMPFHARIRVELPEGGEKVVDFRHDIDPERAELISALTRLGLPGPRVVEGPTADGDGGFIALCEVPRGENLNVWALGGTPHRIRLATERTFQAVDLLQSLTDRLLADPAGAKLERRTLPDEVAAIEAADGDWFADTWFRSALDKVRTAVRDIQTLLVFTHFLHFFPGFLRIEPGTDPFKEPMGWPGDARLQANPVVEFVAPFGHFGDPLLGLSMIWIYDCYPFVHAGFVEQYLIRHDLTRRDLAPRLAIRALQVIQRELPVQRPDDGARYWDALHGYLELALSWL